MTAFTKSHFCGVRALLSRGYGKLLICGMLCWHEPNNMWNAILARAYALQSVTLQMVEWQRFKWTAISIIFSFLFATLGSMLDSQLD